VAGITVIDDYAHHPTEVRATLAAARERYAGRRIVAYIQPHTYSRTKALIADWPGAFTTADVVLIGDIYAAREQETLGMSAEVLATALGVQAQAVGDLNQATRAILRTVRTGDVVLTLGAGDSQLVGPMVLAALGQRAE
jgi:UDP-N-acetylmuramate--alanine ligase